MAAIQNLLGLVDDAAKFIAKNGDDIVKTVAPASDDVAKTVSIFGDDAAKGVTSCIKISEQTEFDSNNRRKHRQFIVFF